MNNSTNTDTRQPNKDNIRNNESDTLLNQFAEATALHGIRECITTPYLVFKFLWIVIVLGSTAMCFFQIVNAIRQYRDHPTSTTTDMTVIEELPMIAVCPIKWWDNAVNVANLKLSQDALYYLTTAFPQTSFDVFVRLELNDTGDDTLAEQFDAEQGQREVQQLLTRGWTMYNLIYNLSVSLSTLKCSKCEDGYPKKAITPGGVCFIVKFSSQATNLNVPGQMPLLSYRQPDSVVVNSALTASGTLLIIHGSDMPRVFVQNPVTFDLDKDIVVFYKFSFSVYTRLSAREQVCIKDQMQMENELQCQQYCVQQVTEKAGAKCTWLGMGNLTTPNTMVNPACAFEHWSKFLAIPDVVGQYAQCTRACPPSCTHTTIHTSYSTFYEERRKTKSATIIFNFGAALETLHIKEVPAYTWDTCLANIGGILGLWLGASLMSVFQLMYYATLAILSRSKRPSKESYAMHVTDVGGATDTTNRMLRKRQKKLYVVHHTSSANNARSPNGAICAGRPVFTLDRLHCTLLTPC